MLDRGAFDLERILSIEPNFLTEGDHEHDEDVTSVALSSDRPVEGKRFTAWLQKLVATQGQDILRCKGILAFPEDERRFVVQGVHMLIDADFQRAWKLDEPRTSRFVLIGRSLEGATLEGGFATCLAWRPRRFQMPATALALRLR